jgi:hypothetical protein
MQMRADGRAGSPTGFAKFERKEAEASGPASAFDWCVGKGCRKRWDVARLHGPVGKVSLTPLCNSAGLSPPAVVRATSGSHSRFGLNAASVPMRSEKLSAALFLSQRLSRIGVRNTGTRGAVVRPELQFLQLLPHKTGGLASLTIKGSESWRQVGSRPTREGVLSDATGAIMSVPPLIAPRPNWDRRSGYAAPPSFTFPPACFRTVCLKARGRFDIVSVTRLPRWPVRS